MSGTRVRYSVGGASVGLDVGELRWVQMHRGMDREDYADIRHEHGVFQMTAAQLAVLVRKGQEALATLPNGWQLDGTHDHVGGEQ